MEDMERYGDYNDSEEVEDGGSKHSFLTFLKILTAVICIGVVGLLAYRLVLFEHYPKSVRYITFTDELLAYYHENGGEIGALTQELRFHYDDEIREEGDGNIPTEDRKGNFFADHLIVIPGTEELQIAVRYNVSALDALKEYYKLTEAPDSEEDSYLSFRLVDNFGNIYDDVVYRSSDSLQMYRYIKLVFDNVDTDAATNAPRWLRLEVFYGDEEEPFSGILIYENNETYSSFDEYRLRGGERPE